MLWPFTASGVCDCEQRTPVIGNAIDQLPHVGVGSNKFSAVIRSPSGSLSGEVLEVSGTITPEG
jgi:hypothetical protein